MTKARGVALQATVIVEPLFLAGTAFGPLKRLGTCRRIERQVLKRLVELEKESGTVGKIKNGLGQVDGLILVHEERDGKG